MKYSEDKYPLQKESYEIIGVCMEIHRILGKGLLEIVYKDAEEHISWVLNYLVIAKCQLGLIVNFGENSLVTKRVIL